MVQTEAISGNQTVWPNRLPFFEIVSAVDRIGSKIESSGKALQIISGSEAFRRYSWLRSTPVLNNVGDIRGMVVSRNWRVVFEQTSTGLELLGKITLIAGFAVALYDQRQDIGNILNSTEPAAMKGLRLASIAGTATQRALAGGVSGLISLSLFSLQGYCQAAGLLGGEAQKFSLSCVNNLGAANKAIQSTVQTWTDTNRQAGAIIWIGSKIEAL